MKSTIELKTFEGVIEYTFDWDDLPKEANFVAVDENGYAFWYEEKPELGWRSWAIPTSRNGFLANLGFVVFNWKDTLIERPSPKKVEQRIEWIHYTFNCPACLLHAGEPKYAVGDRLVKYIFFKISRTEGELVKRGYKITSIHFIDNVYYYKVSGYNNLIAENEIENIFDEVIKQ